MTLCLLSTVAGNVLTPALNCQRVCREVKFVEEEGFVPGEEGRKVKDAKVADSPMDVALALRHRRGPLWVHPGCVSAQKA